IPDPLINNFKTKCLVLRSISVKMSYFFYLNSPGTYLAFLLLASFKCLIKKLNTMNLIKRNTNLIPMFSIWDDLLNTGLPGKSVSGPAVNILESTDNFLIELAVPGMKKEDFKVEVEHDKLMISAEVENRKEEEETGYTRR